MRGSKILLAKIKNRQAKVAVIGIGYVGLPLALLLAQNGYSVTGFVRSRKKANLIMSGTTDLLDIKSVLKKHINSGKFSVSILSPENIKGYNVYIICVPTPIDKNKQPDISSLISVIKILRNAELSGTLIINESTVAPFTTRKLLRDFSKKCFIVCSPERIDPGNNRKKLINIPKVIAGIDKNSQLLGVALYKNIFKRKLVIARNMETAEMAKMLENTYRAVNIALVNEFARLADAIGIDILDVVNAAKSKWSFQAHYPSIGVGGHCIPVDPYYVLKLARQKGVDMRVVSQGLTENESMPLYLAKKVKEIYKKGKNVLVYGISYKKNVRDFRDSPVVAFCNILVKMDVRFKVYDPLISGDVIKSLGFVPGKLLPSDVFVVGTDHSQIKREYKKSVGKQTIIIDGRNYFINMKHQNIIGVGRSFRVKSVRLSK